MEVPRRARSGLVHENLKFENLNTKMLHKLGRFLQFVGLFVITPAALAGQVLEKLSLGEMFLVAAVGMIVFAIGTNLLQKT